MIFRQATIRLTVAYTVIQLGLFAVFAIGIYSFVTGTFDFDAAESDGEGAAVGAEQGFKLLRSALIIFYAGLLVVIPLSSWLMARAALKPIKASFERQQQFVDGASHEMRTPLSVIQAELELALTRSRSPVEYQAAITTSLEAATGLTRLTDDLLRLSRTTREDLAATFSSVDIDAAVAHVVATANNGHNTGPLVTANAGQGLRIWGSEELISRAIGNVVDNAIKFSSKSDVINVTTSRTGTTVTIEVHDQGIGMTPEQVSHAFERFWRADDVRSTSGHGLGLALVQQILTAHGGSAVLDSHYGAGTTVTLRLPTTSR
ncbi:HAMP domain-containing sensor histidine kinase [Cryobacterium sp. CG_9.6]|uniref:sensor histidine kinase n=1 Tax=Cryobacterium sp. CG_9.6 TaxID=2760710 RepID=UPI002474A9E6|nr:HAMP domain-containing sensor histidine kinase [Cryobacterium sp. CG_9.6]MDH6238533.1 signal transduction histidine kinase [Cryobacterium sp. CG_9.6]